MSNRDRDRGREIIAIDPGETTGVAIFRRGKPGDEKAWGGSRWVWSEGWAVDTWQVNGNEVTLWLNERFQWLNRWNPEVVIEDYRILAGTAGAHVGARLYTAELIGAICYVCEVAGVEVVRQGAEIKRVAEGQMRGRGIEAVGRGRHAQDAELHGWFRILKS